MKIAVVQFIIQNISFLCILCFNQIFGLFKFVCAFFLVLNLIQHLKNNIFKYCLMIKINIQILYGSIFFF